MKNFYKQFISVENLQLELYIHLLTLFCDFLFIFWVNPLPRDTVDKRCDGDDAAMLSMKDGQMTRR